MNLMGILLPGNTTSHSAPLLLFAYTEHACLRVTEERFALFEQRGQDLENKQTRAVYENKQESTQWNFVALNGTNQWQGHLDFICTGIWQEELWFLNWTQWTHNITFNLLNLFNMEGISNGKVF